MIVRELVTILGFKTNEKGLNKYTNLLRSAINATKILAVATIAMGAAFLKGAGNIEQTAIAFETMLGSAEKADQLLKEITEFAAKTPFELTGLIESSKKLLAFGFAGEEIIETMTNLGNISAGVGRDKLPSLILAFGKIRTKGKATMEELNILLEAGVPILDQLATNLNVSKKEIIKMVSAGKVGFEDVRGALFALGGEGGRFAGLMEKQSKSFLGIISNIFDVITNLSNEIGAELLPEAKAIGKEFLEFLSTNKEIIKTNIVGFFKEIARIVAFVAIFIKKLFDRLKPLLKQFDEFVGGGIDIIQIIKDLIKFLKPIIDALVRLGKIIGGLVGEMVNFFFEMEGGEAIMEALGVAVDIIAAGLNLIASIIEFLMPVIKALFKALIIIAITAVRVFSAIGRLVDSMAKKAARDIDWLRERIGEAWDWLAKNTPIIWEKVRKGVVDAFQAIINFIFGGKGLIMNIIDAIIGAFQGLLNILPDIIDNIKEFASGAVDVLSQIGEFFGFNNNQNLQTVTTTPPTGGTTTNTTLNVNSNPNITVPPGTPEEQTRQLEKTVRETTRREWLLLQSEVLANAR